jgi:glycine oxidase
MEHCGLADITLNQNSVTAITTTSGQFAVNQLVITAGAWTGQLFRQFFADAPKITPVKGQMLLFDAQPDTLDFIVLDQDQYIIPRRDGKILAGSTVEQDGFNKTTTCEARDRLTAFAINLLPPLKNFPVINHWAGLRPGTEHGIPYIDKHPVVGNLYINAGHFRNGLAMGPGSAQLLVDLVLERPTTVASAPYKLTASH